MSLRVRYVVLAAVLLTTASSAEPPPPNFIEMPYLGTLDTSTSLLRSFDSGKKEVGQAGFPEYFYEFLLDADMGQTLSGSIVTSVGYNATIEVQDAGHGNLGPLTGPLSKPLGSGKYFLHVTPSGGSTLFHFGVVAVPPLSMFPNDAGRNASQPRDLGVLTSQINHSNSFYAYFPRAQVVAEDSAQGSLTPDFNNPVPFPPSPDWYQFTLPKAGGVQLIDTGGTAVPGATFVLVQPEGTASVWGKGQTVIVASGTYSIEVLDQVTQIIGAGGNVVAFSRNPHAENFQHYSFELLFKP
jgi:hypothetical protein